MTATSTPLRVVACLAASRMISKAGVIPPTKGA